MDEKKVGTPDIGERHRITAELVAHLAEIDERRLHLRASYSSLYDFCTNKLGMNPGPAYRHINGARLAQHFLELEPTLYKGAAPCTAL